MYHKFYQGTEKAKTQKILGILFQFFARKNNDKPTSLLVATKSKVAWQFQIEKLQKKHGMEKTTFIIDRCHTHCGRTRNTLENAANSPRETKYGGEKETHGRYQPKEMGY